MPSRQSFRLAMNLLDDVELIYWASGLMHEYVVKGMILLFLPEFLNSVTNPLGHLIDCQHLVFT